MVVIKEIYPTWKLALWRYGRVFLAALIANISFEQIVYGEPDARRTIFVAAIAAALNAIAKTLREEMPGEKVRKIPL